MKNLNHSLTLPARLLAAGLLLALASSAWADVHYVDVNSTNATPPYTNWTTAATNIQDAVDAGVAGDEIVVTNGTYSIGGRATTGDSMMNRVAVAKKLSLRSINGPQSTIIDGGGSVRCVYLTNGASLSGFRLTNGLSSAGGGVFCESLTAVVSNCALIGNSVILTGSGGGAFGGTLNNCTIIRNWVHAGDVHFNHGGGGAYASTLNNCILSDNGVSTDLSESLGGGASYCTLNNCTLSRNVASALNGNAPLGGGAYGCVLNNCTLTGNLADDDGYGSYKVGGASVCTLNDCIVYFNTGANGANYDSASTLNYCCTTPQPTNGVGNITNAPLFADQASGNLRLQSNSPCINAGLNALAPTGPDLDGNPRIKGGIVDLGAYEFEVVHYVDVNSASPTPPYTNWLTAATTIQDAVDAALAGDEVVVTNGLYVAGGRVTSADGASNRVAVDKPLKLRSVNGPQFTTIDGGGAFRCVYLTNGASLAGFTLTNGETLSGGGGVYCAAVETVISYCMITGNYSGKRGAGTYGGTLNNCTLEGNHASYLGGGASQGGGAYGSILNGCILRFNQATDGGGASVSALNDCTLRGNQAFGDFQLRNDGHGDGGGALFSILNNCTLSENAATYFGGGAYGCTLNNSIDYSSNGWSGYYYSTYNYCCIALQLTSGQGNITNAPLFLDPASGNLRLQSSSPCINAGWNGFAPAGSDIDGNPRIAGGTVDIGAYELQSPASTISYAWLQQYGLPTDGSADYTDPDGDGLNNWQEWRCGTDPTNALSALRLPAPVSVGSGLVVRWESVADRTYFLERSTTASSGFTQLATGIPGQPGTTTYTDTNAIGVGPWFYRVGVSAP